VSFDQAVHDALIMGWNVEIWATSHSISYKYIEYQESYLSTGRFSIVCLDDILDEITFKKRLPTAGLGSERGSDMTVRERGRVYEGDRAQSQSRPRSRADDDRDQSQYTSPAAVATGSYGRSTARSQSRSRSRDQWSDMNHRPDVVEHTRPCTGGLRSGNQSRAVAAAGGHSGRMAPVGG
jgi:hypothetical protein